MTIKEILLQKISEVPDTEPVLKELLEILESKDCSPQFKGRPLISPDEAKKIDCDLPLEPEWELQWNEKSPL